MVSWHTAGMDPLDAPAQPNCPTCRTVMQDHPRGFMCWTCCVVEAS